MPTFDVDALRSQFPALARQQDGRPVGLPRRPGWDAGPAAGDRRRRRLLPRHERELRRRVHDERGDRRDGRPRRTRPSPTSSAPRSPDEIKFGANMSTLTLHIGRSIGATPAAGRRDPRHDPRPRGERLDLAGDGCRSRHRGQDRRHPPRRRHPRSRGPRIEARTADEARRRGLRQQRGRLGQPGPRDRGACPRGRRADVHRRRRLRAARPDRCHGARHRLPRLLRVQVVRPARRRAVRQGRGPRPAAGLQGPAGARPVRDGDAELRGDRRDARGDRLSPRRRPRLRRCGRRTRRGRCQRTPPRAGRRDGRDRRLRTRPGRSPDRRPRLHRGRDDPWHHRSGAVRHARPDGVGLDRGRPRRGRPPRRSGATGSTPGTGTSTRPA